MTHPGGRPKGTTAHSDCKLLWSFVRKKKMRFDEAVRESRLARGTVDSCLERFVGLGFIDRTMEGNRPVYRLTKPELAAKYILVPEIRKREARLVKFLPRLDKAAQVVRSDIHRRRYEKRLIPAALKKLEEWAWSKVPEGMAYEDYWGYHPPSIMALVYALKKHPRLLEEGIFQSHGVTAGRLDLEEMLKELKKIEEFERFVRREKAAIRKSARMAGFKKTESANM